MKRSSRFFIYAVILALFGILFTFIYKKYFGLGIVALAFAISYTISGLSQRKKEKFLEDDEE